MPRRQAAFLFLPAARQQCTAGFLKDFTYSELIHRPLSSKAMQETLSSAGGYSVLLWLAA